MAEDGEFIVWFWGVRGSIPCPGAGTVRYGGNTSCVEMRCGPRLLIFDAGSGIRLLGQEIDNGDRIDADLIFSHTHFDHIVGLPFFCPAYKEGNKLEVWAGHLFPERTTEQVLRQTMTDPFFPVKLDALQAEINFHDFRAGEDIEPRPGIRIRTAPLNHPNNATGYRVEYGGKSVCYVTDTEHVAGAPDSNILGLIEGADALIYDCTYTDENFDTFLGWGHSTWQEGARLCQAAGVERLVIYHHDPDNDDDAMDRIAEAAHAEFPGAVVAREGMTLKP